MKYYGPEGRTYASLAEAIDSGEGFAVLSDDGKHGTYVDWQELDEEDRDELRECSLLPETEVQESMLQALYDIEEGFPPEARALILEDVQNTVLNWTTS